MNREVHVRILWEPGGEIPPGHPTAPDIAAMLESILFVQSRRRGIKLAARTALLKLRGRRHSLKLVGRADVHELPDVICAKVAVDHDQPAKVGQRHLVDRLSRAIGAGTGVRIAG